MPILLLLWGFVKVAWPYLLAALVAAFVYEKAMTFCNRACKTEKAARIVAEKQVEAIKAREAAIALKWAESVQRSEVTVKANNDRRNETFRPVETKARSLPAAVASVRVDPAVVSVFRDAYQASQPTGPAPKPQEAPAADPPSTGELAQWGVAMLRWSTECRDRVTEWENFYGRLQNVQVGPE